MSIIIESTQNKVFKKYKSLNLKKNRELEGLYLLEGQRYIDTALAMGHPFEALLVDSTYWESVENREHYENACEVMLMTGQLMKEISQTEHSQGIIGVMKSQISPDLRTHLECEDIKNILFLDRLQDPGNLGTIIRTADAAGFDTIICSKGTVDAYNPKVVRSTAGSILNVHIFYVDDALACLNMIKVLGFKCVVTALENAIDYHTQGIYGTKNCLVIGNEANGVSAEVIDLADVAVKIPIFGGAESLNAAVAAAIMMYQIISKQ